MMKTLIVHSSKTGNTKKLAKWIHDGLSGRTVLKTAADDPDPSGYDLVAVGFWFQGGKPDTQAAAFLEKLNGCKDQKVFLFATHGAANGSAHAANGMALAKAMVSNCKIVGAFSCQGEVAPDVLAKAQAKDPQPDWIVDAPSAAGRPAGDDMNMLLKVLGDAIR
jgi:flavodoxin I